MITICSTQACFFDKNRLTDGAPPNDRGCRACGKIGHLVADCPRKKAADTRKRENRETRERLRSERSETGSEKQEGPQTGGGRNRTRSELSEHSGNNPAILGKPHVCTLALLESFDKALPGGFACTDIRFRKKGGEEGSTVKKPISEKEAIRAEKREIKRLERKRKKQGKLTKEENISLYSKRCANDTPEDIYEASSLIHDGFDDQFSYKSVDPFVAKSGEVLNYLEFNFEENITMSIVEDQKIAGHDDFDYNKVPTVYKTDGVIDYYAPIQDLSLGYIFWF